MKAYVQKASSQSSAVKLPPSDELRIAVSFKGRESGLGITKFAGRVSSASVGSFEPDPINVDRAIEELRKLGFVVTGRGEMTLSIRGSRALFESTFSTKLSEFKLDPKVQASAHSFLFPAAGAPWKPNPILENLIDDAYIQWPHIYMATKKPVRTSTKRRAAHAGAVSIGKVATKKKRALGSVIPKVSYFHLNVIDDVPRLLNVDAIHTNGGSGAGVRIAMIDTGFAHSHPWFKKHSFASSIVLAPGASNRETDPGSHGTGESANIFAIAPKVTFIGVKLEDDNDPNGGASILEGFQEALKHSPQVISVSMGYDLRDGNSFTPLSALPNSLKALEAEIQAAVASGITVVFSAGNGHYSFPGMMPEVISAGGTFVDQNGAMKASDYASAFPSAIYSGRSVPDFCGLVGMQPHADYIMLPVPPGASIDKENAPHDLTKPNDGWAVFSGTSAAAPQLAGICALLIEKNPALRPAEVKAVLARTARDVTTGHANPSSDANGVGVPAGPNRDGATGTGLVDAFAAWQQL